MMLLNLLIITLMNFSATAGEIKLEITAEQKAWNEFYATLDPALAMFINDLRITNNWNVDDTVALKLRTLNKPLNREIINHRTKKLRLHTEWKSAQCPTLSANMTPAISVKNLKTIGCIEVHAGHFFGLEKIIPNIEIEKCMADHDYAWIDPRSTIIGPSGNSLYGSIVCQVENTVYRSAQQYAYCTLDATGAPRDIKIIDRSYTFLSKYLNETMSMYNANNAECTRFVYILSPKQRSECITVGGFNKTYTHETLCLAEYTTWDRAFTDNAIHTYVWRRRCIPTQNDPLYPPIYLEYRFTDGGRQCNYYKHMVETNDNKPALRYSDFIDFSELQSYIKSCPSTETTTAQKDPLFPLPLHATMHTFAPSDEWPLELFQRMVKMLRKLTAVQQLLADFSRQWAVPTVGNCVQVAILSAINGYARPLCDILLRRCLYARTDKSCLFTDALGNLYYKEPKKKNALEWFYVHDNNYEVLFNDWASRITPPHANIGNPLLYLKTHKKAALTISPKEFVNIFEQRAQQHAQKTWDDGSIGARWSFDEYGMRVQLFDLKTNRLIGFYLINNRSTGTITHVESSDGQQPIFYIDGVRCI